VSSQPVLNTCYNALIELSGTDRKDDWLFCDAEGKRNTGFNKTVPKLFEEAGVKLNAEGEKRRAYSLRHYYAEQRLIELGTNARAFEIIGTNMGHRAAVLGDALRAARRDAGRRRIGNCWRQEAY
jgi:integrase